MKGKLIFFAFGIGFSAFVELLLYYSNPVNWTPLFSALATIPGLLFILILTILTMLTLLWALLMMQKEEKREKERQVETLKTALREALKEDREDAVGAL